MLDEIVELSLPSQRAGDEVGGQRAIAFVRKCGPYRGECRRQVGAARIHIAQRGERSRASGRDHPLHEDSETARRARCCPSEKLAGRDGPSPSRCSVTRRSSFAGRVPRARLGALAVLRDVNADGLDLPAALATVRPSRTATHTGPQISSPARCDGSGSSTISIEHFRQTPSRPSSTSRCCRFCGCGAYQLLHLDRVPAAAAVNDAVAMTRRARKTSAAGLVNAVLRAHLAKFAQAAASAAAA